MPVVLVSAHDLDEDDYQTLTGHDFETSIALTGIYGVHKYTDLIEADADITIYENYPFVTITILLDDLSLQRIIDFEDREIINDYIKIGERRTGKGTSVLLSQIHYATELEFGKLNCHAIGDGSTKESNGYITWAKLGYTMKRKSFLKYQELLARHDIPLMTLEKLLLATNIPLLNGKGVLKSGITFWVNSGFPFSAEFFLRKGSENRNILCRHLKRKHASIAEKCLKYHHAREILHQTMPVNPWARKKHLQRIAGIEKKLAINTKEKVLLSRRISALA